MFYSFRFFFFFFFFFFNDTATTEIYTLSLHDALPISRLLGRRAPPCLDRPVRQEPLEVLRQRRSEEHTSEFQSHLNLVCRLLLEKKKKKKKRHKNQQKKEQEQQGNNKNNRL